MAANGNATCVMSGNQKISPLDGVKIFRNLNLPRMHPWNPGIRRLMNCP